MTRVSDVLVTPEMIEAGNGAFDAFMRRTGTPDENDLVVEIYRAMHSRQPPVEGDEVERVMHFIGAEAMRLRPPHGEGLVFSYGQVERGIKAALASLPPREEQ